MHRLILCTGLLRRGDAILLARCRYPGERDALWVLPGGRQEDGETIAAAVRREFLEESGIAVTPQSLAYVSESVDDERQLHVVNFTFHVEESRATLEPRTADPKVDEIRFVPIAKAGELLRADVLRVPVLNALAGDEHPRYYAFDSTNVQVPFFNAQASPPGRD